MEKSFVLKGNVCYSTGPEQLHTRENAYLVCVNGVCRGVYQELPGKYEHLELLDYSGKMIIPGLVDLHTHAPQFFHRATGMDRTLLEWLNTYTFPSEGKFADLDFAKKAYGQFVADLKAGPNTRSCIFATIHIPATLLLMEQLEASGMVTMVGKVNMDRNAPEYLREADGDASAEATRQWLQAIPKTYENTRPILTPRFTPSCTDACMQKLKEIQREYELPVQSHLSENKSEIAWVQELCPDTDFYGQAYAQFGLFGGENCPTLMAHCVHSPEEEIALMKENGVYVVHCPQSNSNLASGIAPVRHYLQEGLHMGLGSDVAGGSRMSIFRAMADAIQVSKLRFACVDASMQPLTISEAFYLGTLGGGSFFGKVGSFLEGYEFDAVVLDAGTMNSLAEYTLEEELERMIYLSDDRHIEAKYVRGRKII